MGAGAATFFIISLVVFLATAIYILYQDSLRESEGDSTPTAPTLPMSSYIGKSCPVGCSCFPRQDTSGKQMCAYLDNNVMFGCPPDCCTPSCS